jgi:exopolysaccharide biosynthesis polyprenyl glycosylphosphotransferase
MAGAAAELGGKVTMITARISAFPLNKARLALLDLSCAVGALLLAAHMRLGWSDAVAYLDARSPEIFLALLVFPPTFYVFGLYDLQRIRRTGLTLLWAVLGITTGLLVIGAMSWAFDWAHVGRGIVLEFGLILVAAAVLVRMASSRSPRMLRTRCLVVGSSEQAEEAAALTRRYPGAGLDVVGVVLWPAERRRLERLAGLAQPECPVLGAIDALDQIVETNHIDRLIVAGVLRDHPALLRRLRPLRYRGIGLMDTVSLYEEVSGEVPLELIDEDWLFRAATTNSQLHIRRMKRLSDLALCGLLLVPAALILGVAAAAIKLTSRGPILFKQERVGLGSKNFMVLKLRTMFEDAEKLTGPVWSTDDDPRITPLGRILRKFRIDELPQLFNVLRGDMSLVGPRPERPVFVTKLAQDIPFYTERLLVPPGITGWAQVKAPYAASVADSRRKLQFDLYYAKNLSLTLDLLIVAMTVKTMLLGRERVQGGMAAGHQAETTPAPIPLDAGAGAEAQPGQVARA